MMKLLYPLKVVSMLLLLTCVAACSDWLGYTPKDKSTAEQQFSSRDGFYSAVNGVYNRLLSRTLYGQNLTYGMLDIMSKRYNTGSSRDNLNYRYANYLYTDASVRNSIDAIWKQSYAAILNANVILQEADKRTDVLNETDRLLIRGDVLALRAFLHFDMLRLFGPVYALNPEAVSIPYNDQASGQTYELLPAKTVIYEHLIPDLEQAEECLKQVDPVRTEGALASNNEDGDNYRRYRQLRLNYYAVLLLKARVYLWAGDAEHALAEARKLIDDENVQSSFPFVDSDRLLGNTKDPDRVFSSEALFGLYDAQREDIYPDYFDSANLGSSNSLLQPRSGYINDVFANQADYRFQSQWRAMGSLFDFVKYKRIEYNQNNIPFHALFRPLIRLTEAYYIAAEAVWKTDQAAARRYLNSVLRARGLSELTDATSAAQFAETLRLEYVREMWGEGQIFYLFKRHYLRITGNYNGDNANTVGASNRVYVLPLPTSEQENRQ